MSYEYNSESKRLDLPNPFKVENAFYLFAAVIMLLAGISLLLISRSALASHLAFSGVLPLLIGVGLLFIGIYYASRALTQLRFFFGRGEPQSLAADISDTGTSKGADALKETLRQNALFFHEPQGALNGLLYSWIPNLIFAPLPIQHFAQKQFHNALAITVILFSLLVSWASLGNSPSAAWMWLFFYGFTMLIIIKPLKKGATGESSLGVKGLISLILIAILGPVLLPLIGNRLPDISALNLSFQAFILLAFGLIAIGLFFVALMRQMVAPPATTIACEQQSLSMNSHPKQLTDEIDRELQRNWSEQVPNRRYSKISPVINASAGSFFGEILEESQPLPHEGEQGLNYKTALASARYQWLVWLNVLGIVMTLAGVLALIFFANFMSADAQNQLSFDVSKTKYLALGAALLAISQYCFTSGHILWGRFDFTSRITWIEMQGSYQSAKLDYGNIMTDRIKTEKNVINIENMTLRVWVSELDSVSFGKKSPRWIVGMRGLSSESAYLAQHIKQFAANQSIIIAPESSVDLQKIANLAAINQLGAQPANTEDIQKLIALEQNVTKQSANNSGVLNVQATCVVCTALLNQADKFCGDCGSLIAS